VTGQPYAVRLSPQAAKVLNTLSEHAEALCQSRTTEKGEGMKLPGVLATVAASQAVALVGSVTMYVGADTSSWWNIYVLAGPVLLAAAFLTGPKKPPSKA
jgi:uncharacterized protein YaaW (UPF0174 family)